VRRNRKRKTLRAPAPPLPYFFALRLVALALFGVVVLIGAWSQVKDSSLVKLLIEKIQGVPGVEVTTPEKTKRNEGKPEDNRTRKSKERESAGKAAAGASPSPTLMKQ
jgi:hypothetical protein